MSAVDTRHSHGTMHHDHDGGELPHNHKLGDPALTGPRSPSPHSGGVVCIPFGIVLAFFGGVAMLWQSNNHSACGSALVQMASPSACQVANLVWTGGILLLVLGAVLILIGTHAWTK